MYRIPNLIFLFVALSSAACYSSEDALEKGYVTNDFEEIAVPTTEQRAPDANAGGEVPTQKIIRNGSLDFKSRDAATDYRSILSALPAFGAYLEHENQFSGDARVSYGLTLRVPAERFDTLMNHISALAWKLENRNAGMRDVTGEYYDLQSSIQNKQALEERYRSLLAKATTVKDMLEIEQNLNNLRTEIDQLQGRFKYLSAQISLSTIQVNFYQETEINTVDKPGFWASLGESITDGWHGFLAFLLIVVRAWPFGLLFIGLIALWRMYRRARKKQV